MTILVDAFNKRRRMNESIFEANTCQVTSLAPLCKDSNNEIINILKEFPTQTYSLIQSIFEANDGDIQKVRYVLNSLCNSYKSKDKCYQEKSRKRIIDDATDSLVSELVTGFNKDLTLSSKTRVLAQNIISPSKVDIQLMQLLRQTILVQANKIQILHKELSESKQYYESQQFKFEAEAKQLKESNLLLTLYIKENLDKNKNDETHNLDLRTRWQNNYAF